MITVLFHITVKPGAEERFAQVAREMGSVTRAEHAGCIAYRFHRQRNAPRQYVLLEQWRDAQSVDAHLLDLQRLYGPPPAGSAFPQLLHDLTEDSRAVFYDVVD